MSLDPLAGRKVVTTYDKEKSNPHFVITALQGNFAAQSFDMFLKLSRGVWFISILGVLAALLFVYAGLQTESVILVQDEINGLSISRELFFYLVLIGVTAVNALVFIIGTVFRKEEAFRTWFNGLMMTLNIFFIIALFFINALNSLEKFDFARIGFLIYGSVVLISLWALAWPVISAVKKFLPKQTI